MNKKIIPCAVTDEYVKGAGVVVGAAGSHNDVALLLTFNERWDGLAKRITWRDALGENTVLTLLTADMLSDSGYIVPIPAEPKAYAGQMTMTLKGVEVDADGNESAAVVSAIACFKVLPSAYDADAEEAEAVGADAAAQLQAEFDGMYEKISNLSATAEEGDEASVEVADDGTSISMRFVLPKGEKGDKGDPYVLTDTDKAEIAKEVSEVSVPKSEKNNVVYARYDNKDTTIPFSSGSADPYSMVRRDSRGCIISAAPELDNECATKGYVDGLIGDIDVKRTVWVDFDGSCTIEETGWTGTFGELLIKADYGEYATYRSPFALNDLYDFYFVKKLEDVILYFTPLSTKIEQEYRIDYDATATVTLYNDDVKIIYTSDVEENAYINNYEYRTWSVSVDKNPQNLASTTEFGCVKIGGYIAVTDGVISVDKTALLGDVETALDNIIALQEAYIGGEDA